MVSRTLVLATLEWLSLAASAFAGSAEARRREFDLFGTLVIAFVVAAGGGTLRDLLLDRHPVFWTGEPAYVLGVVLVTLATVAARDQRRGLLRRPALIADALGLGLFSYLGTYYARQADIALVIAPVFGIINATFGGVIRDVFFSERPHVFGRSQLYATCSFAGACVFLALAEVGATDTAAVLACIGVAAGLRLLALRFDLRLPL